jgi:hypothetical protein
MSNLWDFSQRASTSPTLEQMAQKFHQTLNELTILKPATNNQSGQGVVTRSQAKQNQNTERSSPGPSAEDFDTNKDLNPSDIDQPSAIDNETSAGPEPEADPEQGAKNEEPQVDPERGAKNEEPQVSNEGDDKTPYLDSTLVAENSDLKIYILKTHFRKMKNFM